MNKLSENYDEMLRGVKVLSVVCNQWGDTGKGKFVDVFADWADIIARGTGGANAGHTISLNGKEQIFHLIPSGILHDADGKINIIGTNVALDPLVISNELDTLEKGNLSYKNLKISKNARLVMPQHLLIDRAKESSADGKIGTTGRGIGPVYEDHVSRIGLMVNDLLNPEVFSRKLERNLRDKIKFLRTYDPKTIKDILNHEHLGAGQFWDEENILNVREITKVYLQYGERLKSLIADTDTFLREVRGRKNILLEGAQGNLLSVDIGSYPYVTSSDCSVSGLAKGVGLKESDIDLNLGIVKAFYMTRVGSGPFPTEIGGQKSEKWCAENGITKQSEKERLVDGSIESMINSQDEFTQGVGIRMAGSEYGATTGRPRRTGWLDLPLLRYSMIYSGPNIILTKIDVLDKCKNIKICTQYRYVGKDYQNGETILKNGDILNTASMDSEIISHCQAIYQEFPGWEESIRDCRDKEKLPQKLQDILEFISKETGARIKIISVGPDRGETIVVKN